MSEMLRMILEPKKFSIHEANSGQEGVAAARRLSPELIILDLLTPGMDGWEVCHEIRSFSATPILVLSVVSKPEIIAQALDEGADDYLLKPTPSSVLIAHINKLTRRAQAERSGNTNNLNYLNLNST